MSLIENKIVKNDFPKTMEDMSRRLIYMSFLHK